MKRIFVLIVCISSIIQSFGRELEFSTAGFFQLPNTGRTVHSMNPAWRFYKGSIENGACQKDFNDKEWEVVSLPHGIEYLPTEASGCINYQGEVWYRKHFTLPNELKGKKLFIHFEAIMGKCKVWINGELLTEHFGGYLPVIVDISDKVIWGEENIIAVLADNSDNPNYPPGKNQDVLDFAYFGGIYRDCWLIAHNDIFITDSNYEDEIAGGGLFVAFDEVSEDKATILLDLHIRNEQTKIFEGTVEYLLLNKDLSRVGSARQKIMVNGQNAASVKSTLHIKKPKLWSPESPELYNLHVLVKDKKGNIVDGYRKRVGIRSIEFKGYEGGFWLNGKKYPAPLIGANRHQDFAVIGNALPNSLHWRDAKKLRDAGLKVIRNAHYPQDPAFMDACDELGLFVIVNTPGWQFWNKDNPEFEKRVYKDIRNMIRRDRNHPSVWLWEPILNETHYPADFAKNTVDIVKEEFPYKYCYMACDNTARGNEYFPVHFTHPAVGDQRWALKKVDSTKTYFTREWGDYVDNWNSHNSPSRCNIAWGEVPMLVQAQHYAKPDYVLTSIDGLYKSASHHVGGTLWHSFDHQRGYHPDPFYGGIMDAFRQPKFSYYMFMSQRNPKEIHPIAASGPMVYIAHEMTPFSLKDITVYSNCDEVRLTKFKDGEQFIYTRDVNYNGMPYPVITFENIYNVGETKARIGELKEDGIYLMAEGLINGEVVATHKVSPSRRPTQLLLWADSEKTDLKADGSDIVAVVAAVADKYGNIKRLNNYYIEFEIEGEGRIIGDMEQLANPRPVIWGTAPVLVQSTVNPGEITVRAKVWYEGIHMPVAAELKLNSHAVSFPMIYDEKSIREIGNVTSTHTNRRTVKKDSQPNLEEVERQQAEFGE
ncbi:MAG: glycoside hydrolase family 2 protein [Odoribacter sp.]|nr:glycoside hydrolase family 2 protein [Odoribacter sp.]